VRPGRGRGRRTSATPRSVGASDPADVHQSSTVSHVDQSDVRVPQSSTQRKIRRQSTALPTLQPSERKRFLFDGTGWLEYELEGLPVDYRKTNVYEQIRIKFVTDVPNGLLWYMGSQHRSTHLSLKARLHYIVTSVTSHDAVNLIVHCPLASPLFIVPKATVHCTSPHLLY